MLSDGRLVVVTGPSHAGKTTTIAAARRALHIPSAAIAIDDIIATLDLGPGDRWRDGLPVAYDVAAAETTVLLDHGFVVFLESTFTFIPPDGEPELHREQLERLLAIARAAAAPSVVVRLEADLDVLHERRAGSGRFDPLLVERIWSRHRVGPLTDTAIVVDTNRATPEDVAAEVLEVLARRPI